MVILTASVASWPAACDRAVVAIERRRLYRTYLKQHGPRYPTGQVQLVGLLGSGDQRRARLPFPDARHHPQI